VERKTETVTKRKKLALKSGGGFRSKFDAFGQLGKKKAGRQSCLLRNIRRRENLAAQRRSGDLMRTSRKWKKGKGIFKIAKLKQKKRYRKLKDLDWRDKD